MLISVLISAGCITRHDHAPASDRIRPYINNSMYWQYEGEPLLLLGGSSNDNIFQHTAADLDEELDRLVSFGGNYIRCTMSSRDAGDIYPYQRDSITNLYDPDNYSYLDISNHNFQKGEIHYKTGLYVWNEVQTSGLLRPINNTKIYARNDIGVECFWRNIFAGAASARFHRPP